jgi:hypothetical protein
VPPPQLALPAPPVGADLRDVNTKSLSTAEQAERRRLGLCFNCDEKYCCGDSRSYWTQTMKENKSSRTKTKKTQDKGHPKGLFSTVDFSKADPLYKCRSVSFYREADGLFTF